MGKQISAHEPCDVCGSSDARATYEDEDTGDRYWVCFSCDNKGTVAYEHEPMEMKGSSKAIPERNLTAETARVYGVLVSDTELIFPYQGGAKHRKRDSKEFWATGKPAGLFGQDKFQPGGRFVVVTEGECDAMAAYSMLSGKYACVSVRNGAGSAAKSCKESYEYLNSFNQVVICFDADEPGQGASKEVAELFGPKARIMKLSRYKDANEYLMELKASEWVDLFWNAPQYVPDGILNAADLWEDINKPLAKPMLMYPFPEINSLTYGIRTGELVVLTAGSGLGKSQALREIIYKAIRECDSPIGLMMLEESVSKTVLSILSLAANCPLHLPDMDDDGNVKDNAKVSPEEKRKLFDDLFASRRVHVFDHFGATGVDNIVNRVRYYAKALGCKLVILDHISIIVSSQEYGDERKALDEVMTRLRMLVQETGIALLAVSHLKRPDGRGHEEGAATSLAQLRGSGSIGQLSDIVIGLERNAQSDDPVERNTTSFRVLKNRFSGLTGPAGSAIYNHETGRMLPVTEEGL